MPQGSNLLSLGGHQRLGPSAGDSSRPVEWGAGEQRSSTPDHCCDSEFCAPRIPLTRARPLSLSSCSCLYHSDAYLAYLPCPCDGHKAAEGPQLTQPHSNGTTEPADQGSRPCSSNAWKRTLPLCLSFLLSKPWFTRQHKDC